MPKATPGRKDVWAASGSQDLPSIQIPPFRKNTFLDTDLFGLANWYRERMRVILAVTCGGFCLEQVGPSVQAAALFPFHQCTAQYLVLSSKTSHVEV